ncbi:ABC-2 type transport system permease protein [Siphonobacter sp. SORGH_AS 1065]|nr:ABC-2 type transport system permease protein [Siphonobacter sp. SORGH_AS_1065]
MKGSLLLFELSYYFKQRVFQASAILFFGLGFLMTYGRFGGPEVYKNGPYVINFIVCLLSIFLIFVSALLCSNAVLRDKSHQMEALIYSTGISKPMYLGIKLTGLLLSVCLIILLTVVGIMIGPVGQSSAPQGSFQMIYYVQSLVFFGLPNAFYCSCFLFAAAIWKQKASIVYVTGGGLFIFYFAASIVGNSPLMATSALKTGGAGLFSTLADPFGVVPFFGETKVWSVWRRNHELYPLTITFCANRLLWTVIAVALLGFLYNRHEFQIHDDTPTHQPNLRTERYKKVAYRNVATQPLGVYYFFAALCSQIRLELSFLFRKQQFLVLAALWIFVYSVELKENLFHGPYNTRFYVTTALVLEQLLPVRLALLLLIFYASELIYREQDTRMQAIVMSTPAPKSLFFLSKIAALATVIAIVISLNILIGAGWQWFTGGESITWISYLSLYYYSGYQLLLFAFLILCIQTFISNKYLGMLLSVVVVGGSVFGKTLGIDSYLLRFGSAPELTYSAINGYGHYTKAYHLYMLFWTLAAGLLGLFTISWWPTGRQDTWWKRIKEGVRQWGAGLRVVACLGLLLMISTGLYIVQKSTGIALGAGRTKDMLWQKQYEQKYKPEAGGQQPVLTAIKIKTDLYPDQQRYIVSGTYIVRNESDSSLSSLWFGVDPSVTNLKLWVAGAIQTKADKDFGQFFYQLKQPLRPNQQWAIGFSMEVNRSGYHLFDSENAVVSNGSYIELEKFLPFLGYNDRLELKNSQDRKRNGLLPRTVNSKNDKCYHLIQLDHTVSTNADQQVVTVGTLQKSWQKGQRRYFHYKTEQPIQPMFALSSMKYDVWTQTQNGITFRIYYHPGQTQNLRAMMQAMQEAMKYGGKQFSKYPLKQITLAEIPVYRGAATAYPSVVFSQEKYNFLVDARDTSRLNISYATTAHETAHQWWGYTIRPQAGAGDAFLTESLAKYTEAVVVEKSVGKWKLSQYLHSDNELYFSLRNGSGEPELPLDRSWEQFYVHYQKGGLAMYSLRERLSERWVNSALRRLIAKHTPPNVKPLPEDLISELKWKATPSQRTLIEEQLEKVVIYDNRIQIHSLTPLTGGRFRVRLLVTVYKTDESQSIPKPLPANDWVDIAIFGRQQGEWDSNAKPIYFQKLRVVKPQTVVEITLNQEPKAVTLDPLGYLLDTNQENNTAVFSSSDYK